MVKANIVRPKEEIKATENRTSCWIVVCPRSQVVHCALKEYCMLPGVRSFWKGCSAVKPAL